MEKYLRHYAEPEIAALDGLPDQGQWANVLVIPASNESPEFLRPPPPCDGRSLMILVINETVTAPPQVSLNNQALAATVRARFESLWQSSKEFPGFELSLLKDPFAPRDVLLVDRFSEACQLSAKGGVGHARKIGADLALSLIHRQRISSPWIHCSDADVKLPKSYFTCSDAVQNTMHKTSSKYAALIYPFQHCDDQERAVAKEVILATQLYEFSLRYYVAGMKFARSPYAFNTIGSTIAVSAIHYAKVRGFPKREAAEDFYLLNKLAKVGLVLEGLDCEPIEIAARRSDRVPFGTGAAVNKITDLAEPVSDYRFYHPAVFDLLQHWLLSLPAIWQSRSNDLGASVFNDASGGYDQTAGQRSLLAGLNTIGTEQALAHAFKQSKNLEQFTRQMHTWFDAFRTLKLIHHLRDHHLSSVKFAELVANQIFCQLLVTDPDLMASHQQLQQSYPPR